MTETYEQLVERCGLITPLRDEDLSEMGTKLTLQLELLRSKMEAIKKSLSSRIDEEKTSIIDSVKTLWKVTNP